MRIPPSFYHLLGRVLLFIAIEAICVAMVTNDGIVQQYRVIGELRDIQTLFWKAGTGIKDYTRLKSINKDVTLQNLAVMQENNKLREYINSIGAGRISDSLALLYGEKYSQFEYDWAKVIKNTFNTPHNFIIINKGSLHGISEDMGVITPVGVVGIVRAVGKRNAYIHSFLNNKQQVSAKVGNGNTFGPLAWDGLDIGYANLNEIPQHVDVNPGDTIYTSGYSSFFPPDIPIGIAESSKIVNGMHRSVRVKLLQDFRLLDNVIIVKNNNFREIDSLSTLKGIE